MPESRSKALPGYGASSFPSGLEQNSTTRTRSAYFPTASSVSSPPNTSTQQLPPPRTATPAARNAITGTSAIKTMDPRVMTPDPAERDSLEALERLRARFDVAFRPVSVSTVRPPSSAYSRASTPGAIEKAVMSEVIAQSAIARRQARLYIREVTSALRQDPSLFRAFSQQQGADSGVPKPQRGLPIISHNAANASRAASVPLERHEKYLDHEKHCTEVYEAKQQHILADYIKIEDDVNRHRGEHYSRKRQWLTLAELAKSVRVFSTIIDRRRKLESDALVQRMYFEHVATQSGESTDPGSLSRRRASVWPGGRSSSEVQDVFMGVHMSKLHLVDQRREMARVALTRNAESLKRLTAVLRVRFTYWVQRHLRRRKIDSVCKIVGFLRKVHVREKTRKAIREFLYYMKLLVRRWREAFLRERQRIVSLGKQWDKYMAERLMYDRVACADAERQVRRREKSIVKAHAVRRKTEASVAQVIRARRAATGHPRRSLGPDLDSSGGDTDAPEARLSALQVARLVAAPHMVPHPFGRLGPDPLSARTAALATLNALGFEKMVWRVPHHTKDFVIRCIIARERVSFYGVITAWQNDMRAAEARHKALTALANVAVASGLEEALQQLSEFKFPPMPRRRVFLKPNEMRFWVHAGILLYAQERRMIHDANLSEKHAYPSIVAAVYNVSNISSVIARSVAPLGEKLSGITPGHLAEPLFPIECPPPVIPDSLLSSLPREVESSTLEQ